MPYVTYSCDREDRANVSDTSTPAGVALYVQNVAQCDQGDELIRLNMPDPFDAGRFSFHSSPRATMVPTSSVSYHKCGCSTKCLSE